MRRVANRIGESLLNFRLGGRINAAIWEKMSFGERGEKK